MEVFRKFPEISRTKRGAATALAESPHDAKVLWVGTDDGALWITRDGGKKWKDITENVKLTGHFQVNAIESSRYAEGRAYVAFDGHRSDNDDPHIYVTEDFGATWKALNANLPDLIEAQITLGQRLYNDARTVVQVGAKLPKVVGKAGGQALACIAAGADQAAKASVRVRVSIRASATVTSRVGG